MAENLTFEHFEKYDMLVCFILSNENIEAASGMYFHRYPERRQPNISTFYRIKNNLLDHGSFNKPRPKIYNKEHREVEEVTVLANAEAYPTNSCRASEKSVGVPKTKVHKILRKHKYHPYKFRLVQHLHPGDAQRRVVFCNWYRERCDMVRNFEMKVIWSDEAHFSNSGILNRHNSRFWSQENQHQIFPRRQQGRFGLNVSCFILGTQIKFYIFEGNLTAHRYVEILETAIPDLLDDVPLAYVEEIYFQQDGAPAHNSQLTRLFLENNFRNQWIGTNGPIRWPARSPDLSILDFFLWGYLENKIYKLHYDNVQDLENAIRESFRYLQNHPVILLNSLKRIAKVCEACIQQNGNHFEQFF